MRKKLAFIIFCLLITIFDSSCTPPVLTLEPEHFEMLVSLDGEEDDYYEELILKSNGKRVDGKKAKWYSDQTDVAVVDKFGWVTSKGIGRAVITAVYKGSSVSCTVEVERKITSDTRTDTNDDD